MQTDFKNYITNIVNFFNRSVIITEFCPQTTSSATSNPSKYTQAQVDLFLQTVIPWMNNNPSVIAYAYHDPKVGTCSLFNTDGTLTTILVFKKLGITVRTVTLNLKFADNTSLFEKIVINQ